MNFKFNFVRDGESKLPPGFRFQPTDEEIVFQYLARKILSYPLPASVIPQIDMIFSFHPWDLPGNWEQDRYFFANREVNPHGNNIVKSRKSCVGFWKVTGSYKQIICSKRMPIMGIKKTLVWYKGKHPRATPTDCFMHFYSIALSPHTPCNIHHKKYFKGSLNEIGKWVLCHVFSKKQMNKSEVYCKGRQVTADTSDKDDSSSSSSSASSAFSSYDSNSNSDFDSSVGSEVCSSTANSGSNS